VKTETPARFRLDGVDLLRGLCVLLVVLHHIHLRFKINKYPVNDVLPETLNQVLFWSGYYAVISFFVISGFLITSLSIRRWNALGTVHPLRFYGMRMARILPCLFLILLISSVLHLLQVDGFVLNPERASLGRGLVAALTFHVNWLEGHRGYMPGAWGVMWSLSVEEVFYLAFPLVCLICHREKWFLIPLLCMIVLGPINRTIYAEQDPWGSYAYLSCMDGMAFGCLAALISARVNLTERVLRTSLVLGAIIAILVLTLYDEDEHAVGLARYGLNVTLLEVAVALMLIPLGKGVGNRAMSIGTGWLRAVGRWSYEIYLFHMLVLLGFMTWFRRAEHSGAAIVAMYAAMLLASIALGALISRYFSEPLNRRLRRGHDQPRATASMLLPSGSSTKAP
jgi:peptidoglycan/LPS O-acetylase OafA/YrhL